MSSIFKNRFIYCILFSALFLQMGIWIRNFSILLFVTEQTNGNAIAISFIMLAEYAPIFVFFPRRNICRPLATKEDDGMV